MEGCSTGISRPGGPARLPKIFKEVKGAAGWRPPHTSMEMYLKQARLHALDGRFDAAIYSLIEAVRELAESVAPASEDEVEGETILSGETRQALLALRKAFFDLLAAARGREWDQLAYKYPFSLSFDDLTDRVAEWVEAHCGEL